MSECILIVTGSRECKDYDTVELALDQGIEKLGITPTKIMHGDSPGVEKLSSEYAKKHGMNCEKVPPNWKNIKGVDPKYIKENKFGKYNVRAAIERNDAMVEKAHALIALDMGSGECRGIISSAQKNNLKVYVYEPEETDHDYGYVF